MSLTEFYAYLQCGILAHGFVRLGCDTCPHQMLLAFSCKKRGFCPSCAGRRMAQQAAHLVEQVLPWVPTRQWVVSVPIPLRYWMAPSRELTARVHTIIRRTIGQYYVKQAVKQGATRAAVQPGSVTFVQRFGGSINAQSPLPCGLPRGRLCRSHRPGPASRGFCPPTPHGRGHRHGPSDDQSARHPPLRKLGYLEAGTEDVVPTGYDPASDEDPELARTMAASVQQRIAFGERAGQRVRRIGSGFGYEGERRP